MLIHVRHMLCVCVCVCVCVWGVCVCVCGGGGVGGVCVLLHGLAFNHLYNITNKCLDVNRILRAN